MLVFVHQYAAILNTPDGRPVVARVYADRQPKGSLWEAWFVFFFLEQDSMLATDRETTQAELDNVSYWASGISPTYLEGALARALGAKLHLARRSGRDNEAGYAARELEVYERVRGDVIALARDNMNAVGVQP